jgi:hypothetical protein
MNNKGQVAGVGGMILMAIIIIVGVILLQGSAQNLSSVLYTVNLANRSVGSIIVDDAAQYFTDIKSLSSVVILNQTNGTAGFIGGVIESGNYTVTNNVVYNGGLAVKILPGTIPNQFNSVWVVSGVGEPTAYADSAGRSMANIIIIMMAVALLAAVVVYAVKSYNE